MTSPRPNPPIPADADLRHFPCVSINAHDLRSSDMAIEGDPADNWYCMMLLMVSWHQVPAGSLPEDDAKLAYLAGLGRDLRTWRKHKSGALRGWVLCSDGRFYHPMMVEAVQEALQKSRQQRANIKKRWERNATNSAQPFENIETQNYYGTTEAIPRTEQNRIEQNREESPPYPPPCEPPEAETPLPPPDPPPDAGPPPRKREKTASRGSRMREDWTLPSDWREEALRLGLAFQRVDGTAEEFCDYWLGIPGARGLKADWKATWRNRVRDVVERERTTGIRPARTGATTADLAAKIRAEMGGDPRFRAAQQPPPPTAIETDWETMP